MIPRYDQLPEYMFAMNDADEQAVYERVSKLAAARKAIPDFYWSYLHDKFKNKDVIPDEDREKFLKRIAQMEYRYLSLCHVFSLCFHSLRHFTEFIGKELEEKEEVSDPLAALEGDEEEEEDEEAQDKDGGFLSTDAEEEDEEDGDSPEQAQAAFNAYLSGFADLKYLDCLLDGASKGSMDAQSKLKGLVAPYRTEMLILIRTVINMTDLVTETTESEVLGEQ